MATLCSGGPPALLAYGLTSLPTCGSPPLGPGLFLPPLLRQSLGGDKNSFHLQRGCGCVWIDTRHEGDTRGTLRALPSTLVSEPLGRGLDSAALGPGPALQLAGSPGPHSPS